jgi:hypothetical protein
MPADGGPVPASYLAVRTKRRSAARAAIFHWPERRLLFDMN